MIYQEVDIIDELIFNINKGSYKEEEKMPSENELAEYYGVPRITVRKCYEKLDEMGYTYTMQGKGRYLKARNKKIELTLTGEKSFTEKIVEQGYNYRAVNLYCIKIQYNSRIYGLLGLDKSDEVYKIGILRVIEGIPIAIHTSYLPKRLFNDIDIDGKYIKSMRKYYKVIGIEKETIDIDNTVSIVYPTAKERDYLQCNNLVPLLKLESKKRQKNSKQIIEITDIVYRSDCFKYKI